MAERATARVGLVGRWRVAGGGGRGRSRERAMGCSTGVAGKPLAHARMLLPPPTHLLNPCQQADSFQVLVDGSFQALVNAGDDPFEDWFT